MRKIVVRVRCVYRLYRRLVLSKLSIECKWNECLYRVGCWLCAYTVSHSIGSLNHRLEIIAIMHCVCVCFPFVQFVCLFNWCGVPIAWRWLEQSAVPEAQTERAPCENANAICSHSRQQFKYRINICYQLHILV